MPLDGMSGGDEAMTALPGGQSQQSEAKRAPRVTPVTTTLGVRRASLVSTRPAARPVRPASGRSRAGGRGVCRDARLPCAGVQHVALATWHFSRPGTAARRSASPGTASAPCPRSPVAGSREALVRAVLSLGLSGPGTPCGWPSVPTFRVCAPSPVQLGPGLAPRAPARPPLCVAADGRDGVGGHRAHRRVPAAAQAPGALHPLHRPGDLPTLPLLRHQRTYRSAPPDHAS